MPETPETDHVELWLDRGLMVGIFAVLLFFWPGIYLRILVTRACGWHMSRSCLLLDLCSTLFCLPWIALLGVVGALCLVQAFELYDSLYP